MEQKISRQFFLGANTGAGFVSLYPAFAAPEDGAFVWYIKGGPGNGKSTLMCRAAERAEEAGFAVESILCSGDPDSLDGIYIPEKKLGYVDATSLACAGARRSGRFGKVSRPRRILPSHSAGGSGENAAALCRVPA